VTVAVYVRACLGVGDEVAMDPLRRMAGLYASSPSYRRAFEAMGLGEGAAAAAAAHAAGRPGEVPERFVRALAVTGGRAEALARFAEYRGAGAHVILCYPVTALEPFSSAM